MGRELLGARARACHGLFDIWSFDGHRRHGLQRPRRRLADLRQRPAPQGREVVRARVSPCPAAVTRTGRSPGPTSTRTTTRVESMIGAATVPVRRHGQDQRPARGRRGCGALGVAAAARGDASPAARDGEPVRAGEIETPAYGNIHGLPRSTCRSAASATSAATTAPRTPSTTPTCPPPRTHGADIRARREVKGFRPLGATRAAATRSRTSSTTGVDGEPASRAAQPQTDHVRAPGAGGGHVRDDVPAAPQPHGVPRAERGARHPVLRQRRPARVRDERGPRRPGPRPGARSSAGRSSPAPSGSATTLDGDGASGRGYYIEDAGYPVFADWLAETGKGLGHARAGRSSSATGRPSRT